MNCHGTCHFLANGLRLLTIKVDGYRAIAIVSKTGNCHEAAWLAHILAARIARSRGETRLVIRNTSRHVVHQLNGTWKTRSPMMRRFLLAFRHAFGDMQIIHAI